MKATLNRLTVPTVERLDYAVVILAKRGRPTSRAALVREAVTAWLDDFESQESPQPSKDKTKTSEFVLDRE